MQFLKDVGEQTCMIEGRQKKSKELFMAVNALY
jgi:hypothetical protein